jgi:hypothetical protein
MAYAVRITILARRRAILEKWKRNRAGTSGRFLECCEIILLSCCRSYCDGTEGQLPTGARHLAAWSLAVWRPQTSDQRPAWA